MELGITQRAENWQAQESILLRPGIEDTDYLNVMLDGTNRGDFRQFGNTAKKDPLPAVTLAASVDFTERFPGLPVKIE